MIARQKAASVISERTPINVPTAVFMLFLVDDLPEFWDKDLLRGAFLHVDIPQADLDALIDEIHRIYREWADAA